MRDGRPARVFEKVPMSSVPDPINRRTESSEIWPLFEAICALPGNEQFAVQVPTKDSKDANAMMNKLKKWASEYASQKRFLNNRSRDHKTIWIWWVQKEFSEGPRKIA